MIPFPFNENRFSFVVADHLLVGQLCTNPKSDRSLLSCLFNEQDRRCTAVQLMLSTDPSYDNRTIASTLKMQIRTLEGTALRIGRPFGGGESHIMPPHIFEVGLKVITKVYLDVLKSVVIPGCNQVAGGRPWVWQQDSAPDHKSKETQAWLQKQCYDLVPFSHWRPLLPRPEPAGLLRLIIRREHHQYDLPQYQSQSDRCHPPSIRRAPAGACRKGMPPVPDPYWSGDWGWRWLHWIDVSSTT